MSYLQTVAELLSCYRALKFGIRMKRQYDIPTNNKDKQLLFLDYCLDSLEDYEQDLIRNVCIRNISIRKYSERTGYSRNYISKKRDEIIALISVYFEMRYTLDDTIKLGRDI